MTVVPDDGDDPQTVIDACAAEQRRYRLTLLPIIAVIALCSIVVAVDEIGWTLPDGLVKAGILGGALGIPVVLWMSYRALILPSEAKEQAARTRMDSD